MGLEDILEDFFNSSGFISKDMLFSTAMFLVFTSIVGAFYYRYSRSPENLFNMYRFTPSNKSSKTKNIKPNKLGSKIINYNNSNIYKITYPRININPDNIALTSNYDLNHVYISSKYKPIIERYTKRIFNSRDVNSVLSRLKKYEDLIKSYSATFKVPYVLVEAVIAQESSANHNVISKKGAIGIMQLMPETANYLKVNPYRLRSNIRAGIIYLKEKLDYYGSVENALARYNCSRDLIIRAMRISKSTNFWVYRRSLPKETRDYVVFVLGWANLIDKDFISWIGFN